MYESLSCTIEGTSPLLMHSSQLASPLNEFAVAMKDITGKPAKSKTEEDWRNLAHLEFMGSIYLDDNGVPAIPGELIEACIRDGARKTRKGKDVLAGVLCDGCWPLKYKGPTDPEELFEDKRFVDSRTVGVKQNKVLRTRPRFDEWKCEFVVEYLPDLVNLKDLQKWITTAGQIVGIGDYRPRFGRFSVVKFAALKSVA